MDNKLSTFCGLVMIYGLFVATLIAIGCGDFNGESFNEGPPVPEATEQPSIQPTPVPTPELTNPRCLKQMGTDGEGGFLWKPIGDSKPTLVVLFPKEFKRGFERVVVFIKGGGRERLDCYGRTNGDRLTCRGKMQGKEYTGLVRAFDFDQVCEWKVSKPGSRND